MGSSFSNVFYEILAFWLMIFLVIFFLIKGILAGKRQKRTEEILAIKKRLDEIEKKIGHD